MGGKEMTTRYCKHCKVRIGNIDKETKCPICLRETIIETDELRVKRVRAIFAGLARRGTK